MDSKIKELISFAVYASNEMVDTGDFGTRDERQDKALEDILKSFGCEIIYDDCTMKVFTPDEGQIKFWRC